MSTLTPGRDPFYDVLRAASGQPAPSVSVALDGQTARVFTFGYGHTDPVTGEDLGNTYAIVQGEGPDGWRKAMLASVFGNRFAFEYLTPEQAGVERWNMRCHAYIYADGRVVRASEVQS